jgi:hypothetical protein
MTFNRSILICVGGIFILITSFCAYQMMAGHPRNTYKVTRPIQETHTKDVNYTVTRPVYEKRSRIVAYSQMNVITEQKTKTKVVSVKLRTLV